jgi:TetR/AcrR family transcriptional regulator, transcriptional repressor for nem operon
MRDWNKRARSLFTRRMRSIEGMRDQIKELALELLIKYGYRGVSFGDLAEALKTTRANIHYHFGNKEGLVEQVLEEYVDVTSTQLHSIWTKSDVTLFDKIDSTVEYSRKRYLKFNPRGHAGHPWSLISRMRQDSDALTPRGRDALQRFGRNLFGSIVFAIEDAKKRGEFDTSMPTDDVALQLVSIANSAGPITQDAGAFDRLEQVYLAFARIITHGYGKGTQAGPPTNMEKKLRVLSKSSAPVARARASRRTVA